MPRSIQQLRDDAVGIWNAGIAGVESAKLVQRHVVAEPNALIIAGTPLPYEDFERIVVVGGGKAGAGMSAGLETALGGELAKSKRLQGSVAVPANCVREAHTNPLIETYASREAGVNEPTEIGVVGARNMLSRVAELNQRDVCICLISGGGSALLPCPTPPIRLVDKLKVTQVLSAAGADITELNTVRAQLSDIKGGGLARACRAGWLFTLIISDVLGDPLDIIASGPTTLSKTTASDALAVLEKFNARKAGVDENVFQFLQQKNESQPSPEFVSKVKQVVIGNNAIAVDAAGLEAERRGYDHAMLAGETKQPTADEAGRRLANVANSMRNKTGPNCLITGGEPTVKLAPAAERGRGGRNQQLALSALATARASDRLEGMVILSGGTDGEDGPTDAAGGMVDAEVMRRGDQQNLDPEEYLRRNDAYSYLDRTAGLFRTGPTDTNVCDLRVVVVDRE